MSLIVMKRSALAVLLCFSVLLTSCGSENTEPTQPDVPNVPATPSNLTLSETSADFVAGTSAAVLSWDNVGGEASFELERQDLLVWWRVHTYHHARG